MRRIDSLRLRLVALLLGLGALVALGVGLATYAGVRAEVDTLSDYQLRQMALSLRDQGRIADNERDALADPDLDYVVQIWSIDGVALYSSLPRARVPALPQRAVLGFSDVRIAGADWRVFGAATPLRVIQVAQPLAVRRQLATAAAGRSVLPIVVAAPIVGLLIWWVVGLSLAPLQRVVAATQARTPESLEPLPTQALPSEVLPMVAAFNRLLGRLADAFSAQRAFVADAAHELRTPLTALKLQLGLLQSARDDRERQGSIDRLRAGVDRASHLVEQLLTLARAEPGDTLRRERLDAMTVVRQAIADAAELAERHQVPVTLDTPSGAVGLDGDAGALRSLLRNLIDNAIKYGASSPVTVRVSDDGEAVRLQVDDGGPGIPPEERERVFDRFHRREGSPADGSGLGLAIVQAIARQHGGQVTLGDAPTGGLRVEVRLPRRA